MKNFLLILALCIFSSASFANDAAQKMAIEAQSFYDAQKYNDAAKTYETLIETGKYAPEIFYNLGNAYFKNGDLPKAILNFHRAEYFMPNDPELVANLKFAYEKAGLEFADKNLVKKIAFSISEERWVIFAVGGYIFATALILGGVLAPRFRSGLFKTASIPVGIALLASFGILQWESRYKSNEQVLMINSVAKFAPMETSKEHFSIPAGTLVKTTQKQNSNWIEIELNGETGWVEKSTCLPVSFWR